MAEIDERLVRYVAALARLEFDEGEIAAFTEKFRSILSYVDQLGSLDTAGVAPTYHVLPVADTMRDDIVVESCPADRILQNAPDRHGSFFRVPRVVE